MMLCCCMCYLNCCYCYCCCCDCCWCCVEPMNWMTVNVYGPCVCYARIWPTMVYGISSSVHRYRFDVMVVLWRHRWLTMSWIHRRFHFRRRYATVIFHTAHFHEPENIEGKSLIRFKFWRRKKPRNNACCFLKHCKTDFSCCCGMWCLPSCVCATMMGVCMTYHSH